jgi:hypothetical protein
MDSADKLANTTIRWALPCLSQAPTPYAAHFPAAALCTAFALREYGTQIPVDAIQKALRTLRRAAAEEIGLTESTCIHSHKPEHIQAILLPAFHRLSRSGHLQIIGAVAAKAAKISPDLITCQVLTGLTELVEICLVERPDAPRYWGFPSDYEAIPERATLTPPRDVLTAARAALDELARTPVDGEIDGVTYFFTGERLHALTLAHALIELEGIRYHDLTRAGLDVFSLQIHLNRMQPPGLWEFHTPVVPPLTAEKTWRKDPSELPFDLAHRIKRSYANHRIHTALRQAATRSA